MLKSGTNARADIDRRMKKLDRASSVDDVDDTDESQAADEPTMMSSPPKGGKRRVTPLVVELPRSKRSKKKLRTERSSESGSGSHGGDAAQAQPSPAPRKASTRETAIVRKDRRSPSLADNDPYDDVHERQSSPATHTAPTSVSC